MNASAVVFGYHDVGVRCLKVLLSAGIDVPLVVTNVDDPHETQWFGSVARTAEDYGIPVIAPNDANSADVERTLAGLRPDFIFSFYYRSLLDASLLRHAQRAALNMHGSLLPKFRGRAPVNWAILHGESETGATLHEMVARADAGDIVDQMAVPILRDDDAHAVFNKVTAAAEIVLHRSLPHLIDGTASRTPQNLRDGQYFGRRRAEDGRIDWRQGAVEIHNLVRAVAPPFPGAFTDINDNRLWIHKTLLEHERARTGGPARLFGDQGRCYIACADGGVLRILTAATVDGPVMMDALARAFEQRPFLLG